MNHRKLNTVSILACIFLLGRVQRGRASFLDRTIEILCLRLFLWSATNPYWCRILAAYLSLRKNVSFTFHSSVFLDDNLRCFSWRRWNCCRHRRLFGRFTSFSSIWWWSWLSVKIKTEKNGLKNCLNYCIMLLSNLL